MPVSKQKFQSMLEAHDWWYEWSDNYTIFVRGRENANRLEAIARTSPELQEMYDDYVKKINEVGR